MESNQDHSSHCQHLNRRSSFLATQKRFWVSDVRFVRSILFISTNQRASKPSNAYDWSAGMIWSLPGRKLLWIGSTWTGTTIYFFWKKAARTTLTKRCMHKTVQVHMFRRKSDLRAFTLKSWFQIFLFFNCHMHKKISKPWDNKQKYKLCLLWKQLQWNSSTFQS